MKSEVWKLFQWNTIVKLSNTTTVWCFLMFSGQALWGAPTQAPWASLKWCLGHQALQIRSKLLDDVSLRAVPGPTPPLHWVRAAAVIPVLCLLGNYIFKDWYVLTSSFYGCLSVCNCSPVGTIPEQLGHCCCGHPQSHEARSRSSSGGEFICQRLTWKNPQHCCFLFKVTPLTVWQAVDTVASSSWATACLRYYNLHGDSCSLWLRAHQTRSSGTIHVVEAMRLVSFSVKPLQNYKPSNLWTRRSCLNCRQTQRPCFVLSIHWSLLVHTSNINCSAT